MWALEFALGGAAAHARGQVFRGLRQGQNASDEGCFLCCCWWWCCWWWCCCCCRVLLLLNISKGQRWRVSRLGSNRQQKRGPGEYAGAPSSNKQFYVARHICFGGFISPLLVILSCVDACSAVGCACCCEQRCVQAHGISAPKKSIQVSRAAAAAAAAAAASPAVPGAQQQHHAHEPEVAPRRCRLVRQSPSLSVFL